MLYKYNLVHINSTDLKEVVSISSHSKQQLLIFKKKIQVRTYTLSLVCEAYS